MSKLTSRSVQNHGGKIFSGTTGRPVSETIFDFPEIKPFETWCACYRSESCWMVPTVGTCLQDIPQETQMLLLKNENRYTVYIPLVCDGFRASFLTENEMLQVRVESGSAAVTGRSFDLVYANTSENPYELMETAAEDLQQELGTFTRADPTKRPEFMSFYGWCSWNAFYMDVSAEKIESVLASFAAHGLCPGFVIIDGGWQSASKWYLTGLDADASKFPRGMSSAIEHIKSQFNVKHLFLWQTYNGFWCGLDPEQFPDARRADMEPPARLLSGQRTAEGSRFDTNSTNFYPEHVLDQSFWSPASFETFYDEYHRTSSASGADGVKIDAITWIETCGKEFGGRVALMREFLSGAEKSAHRYFNDQVIWCSSCSNDFLFNSSGEGVVRTSTDFFPDKPETHGLHIYANAINSLFMGAFVRPDWDMFQSALGKASEFHAAARAVSGGPVYSTDAFGEENFDLIKKLARLDGTVPLCETYARPTLDSLFVDPQLSLIKVFNQTKTASLLGVFNTAFSTDTEVVLSGPVSVEDIYPLRGSTASFALYSHTNRSVKKAGAREVFNLSLASLEYEIFTVSEIQDGVAPIGDPGFFNSSGVIEGWTHQSGGCRIELHGCAEFVAFSEMAPLSVAANGDPLEFQWDGALLQVILHDGFSGTLELIFHERTS